MHIAMAAAFIKAVHFNYNHKLAAAIDSSIARKVGRFKEGHSTKLSYRTYQALKAQGVLE